MHSFSAFEPRAAGFDWSLQPHFTRACARRQDVPGQPRGGRIFWGVGLKLSRAADCTETRATAGQAWAQAARPRYASRRTPLLQLSPAHEGLGRGMAIRSARVRVGGQLSGHGVQPPHGPARPVGVERSAVGFRTATARFPLFGSDFVPRDSRLFTARAISRPSRRASDALIQVRKCE